jgi:hypothetical protein
MNISAGKFLRRVATKMARQRRSVNRNAVAAFSPVLPRSGYAGWGGKMKSTLKELQPVGT